MTEGAQGTASQSVNSAGFLGKARKASLVFSRTRVTGSRLGKLHLSHCVLLKAEQGESVFTQKDDVFIEGLRSVLMKR